MERMTIFRVVEEITYFDVEPAPIIGVRFGVDLAADASIFGLQHAANEEIVQFDISPVPQTKITVPVDPSNNKSGVKKKMGFAIRVVFAVKNLTETQMVEQFGYNPVADKTTEEENNGDD